MYNSVPILLLEIIPTSMNNSRIYVRYHRAAGQCGPRTELTHGKCLPVVI